VLMFEALYFLTRICIHERRVDLQLCPGLCSYPPTWITFSTYYVQGGDFPRSFRDSVLLNGSASDSL